jgi:hypothetical protein
MTAILNPEQQTKMCREIVAEILGRECNEGMEETIGIRVEHTPTHPRVIVASHVSDYPEWTEFMFPIAPEVPNQTRRMERLLERAIRYIICCTDKFSLRPEKEKS